MRIWMLVLLGAVLQGETQAPARGPLEDGVGAAATRASDVDLRLSIALVDCAEVPDMIEEIARNEVERLLLDYGIGVTWLSEIPIPGVTEEGWWQLRVVISPSDPVTWHLPANTMGVTTTRKTPAQAVYVFRRVVERFVGDERRYPAVVGRTLGRVIVHEVAHAMGADHAAAGLMSPALAQSLMEEDGVALAADEGAQLRQTLLRLAMGSPAGSPAIGSPSGSGGRGGGR